MKSFRIIEDGDAYVNFAGLALKFDRFFPGSLLSKLQIIFQNFLIS